MRRRRPGRRVVAAPAIAVHLEAVRLRQGTPLLRVPPSQPHRPRRGPGSYRRTRIRLADHD